MNFFFGNPLAQARQGSDAEQARPGFYAGQLESHSHWQKKACCSPPPTGGLEFFSWEESRPWRGLGRLQAPMPGRFAETVGLDDSFEKKIPGKNPDLGLGRAPMPGRRGREAMPGRHQPAEPSQSPGPLLYVLYELYLTRQAADHPLSPASLLHVLYVLYLTRQATEHPLSPGSLLYVLYVLYLTRQATEHPLSPGFLAICAICAIWPYIAHIVQISRVQNI